jgi:hypothetical protein
MNKTVDITHSFLKIGLLWCYLASASGLHARTVTAIANGNWTTTGTWGGTVPVCGDTVVIPAGITVTINDVLDFTACTQWMRIVIHGTMTFQTGKKIRLPCNSVVVVTLGGQITAGGGGGSSNLIEICSVTVWTTSMGNLSGPVTLGNEPLPISLLHFSAQSTELGVVLRWITGTENGNRVFYIGKSDDGKTFRTISSVPGAGYSGNPVFYEFLDEDPIDDIAYYRLVQVDYDGSEDFSEILAVRSGKEGTFSIYPNPCAGELFGSLSREFRNQRITVVLSTLSGQVKLTREIAIGSQLRAVRLLTNRDFLRPGYYLFSIEWNGTRISQPLVVN